MTSSSEQPPKELGILLNPCNHCRIVDACIDAHDDDEYPPCYTRPHPTPAPCPQHQIWQHCPVAGEIARKAREDVLDKVIAWKRKHGYWFTINGISGEKRYHFEPDRFEEFIKEIRHNAPQTEQEQPR
jgi:hypothetical protein